VSEVHLVLPQTVDDPARPSGGNRYDRQVAAELARLGWQVHEHLVAGDWPHREVVALSRLEATVSALPDAATVLVDGLLASVSDDVLVPHADRVHLVVLVHLPLGGGVQAVSGRCDAAVTGREARVLTAAKRVVVTSGWTRGFLVERYGLDSSAVVVAPPGVEAAPVSAGTPTGSGLLCVGALTPVKGHDILAQALTGLRELDWRSTWLGSLDLDPDHVRRVRALLRDGHVLERVELAGPAPARGVADAYAASDLVVVPSRMETYGLVVTEALARGLPVVAADVGGVREALGRVDDRPPGMLVPPGDPAALADALHAWLTDQDLRESLRAAARRRRTALAGWSTTGQLVAGALVREPGPTGVRLPQRTL